MTESKAAHLAAACRQLASECEAGTGPALGKAYAFDIDRAPCCAIGHAYYRAEPTITAENGWRGEVVGASEGLAWLIGGWQVPAAVRPLRAEVEHAVDVVTFANDQAAPTDRARAVVQPLRALADALDAWDRATTGG